MGSALHDHLGVKVFDNNPHTRRDPLVSLIIDRTVSYALSYIIFYFTLCCPTRVWFINVVRYSRGGFVFFSVSTTKQKHSRMEAVVAASLRGLFCLRLHSVHED